MRRLAWTLAVRICYNASFPVTLLKCWLTTIPRSHKFVLFQSTDSSKAVVPVLVLLFVALWFILRGDLFFCLTLYFILFVCFSVLLVLQLPRLGKRERERGNLRAFHTFVRVVLVWFCRFPFPLSVWEGLRFVIVAHPGLFSDLFSSLLHIPFL